MIKRIALTISTVLLLTTVAMADPTLVCWETEPFADTFRLLVEASTEDDQLFAIPAVHWQGLNVYQMSGSTATRLFEGTPAVVTFGVLLDNVSSAFGSNPNCRFRAVLLRDGLNGSWTIDCTGGVKPFSVTGTAFLAPCFEPQVAQFNLGSNPRPLAGQ